MKSTSLLALLTLLAISVFTIYSYSALADQFNFGNFYFDMPYASNGPGCSDGPVMNGSAQPGWNCPNNDPAYDMGAVFKANNGTHVAFQIMGPNMTRAQVCNGSLPVYFIIQIDGDQNMATGVPSNWNGMPGADYEIMYVNNTFRTFRFWNSSANNWAIDGPASSRLITDPPTWNCSVFPTIIRIVTPISDIGGDTNFEFSAATANGTAGFDILSAGSGGGGGGGSGSGCMKYDQQGAYNCTNLSKTNDGLTCKYNTQFGWCDPDFEAMPKTCDYFCGYCNTTSECSSFSTSRGPCQWAAVSGIANGGVCEEMFFQGGMDCSSNCVNCFGEYDCMNKGPKDGFASKCGWTNDPNSMNGGWCDYKEIADKKDCQKNCFACYDSTNCGNSNATCAWINNNADWANVSIGNYSTQYDGFIGCVNKSNHPEICFMPGDEDNNSMADCMDPACAQDPFCGYGFGGGTGGGGGGIDCWINDQSQGHNQADCENYNGTGYEGSNAGKCFWHITPGGGLCDPVFMQNMIGGMTMDTPPMPIGEDASDTSEAWLDILHIGIKESPESIDVGMALKNITLYSSCNKSFGGNQSGTFFRYLDTNENEADGCSAPLIGGGSLNGFEYKLIYSSEWNGTAVAETKKAYKCSSGTWIPFAAQLTSVEDACFAESMPFEPVQFKGVNVLIVKKADISNPTGKIRIFVSSGLNETNVKDEAGPFYYKQGTIDFQPIDCFANPASCGLQFMKTGGQYMPFEDCMNGIDDNGNGLVDCNDPDCGMAPWCQTQYNNFILTDQEAPTVTNNFVDVFDDFAFVGWMTDEPANGTLELYNMNTCNPANRTNRLVDLGDPQSTFDDYKPFHGVPLKNQSYDSNNTLVIINPASIYFYKTISCDKAGNCAYSACLNFTTYAGLTNVNFTLIPPPQGDDVTKPLGFVQSKIILQNGNEQIFNGSLQSMNYTTNATLVLSNPNASAFWQIRLGGINLAKAGSMNFTDNIFVENSSSTTFVGLDASLWQELSQKLGVTYVDIQIPVTFDSNNKIVLRKCENSTATSGCQNVSALWEKKNSTYAINITNSSDYCRLTNWSTTAPVFTEWRCPTSLGFSVFAVYLVEAGGSNPPSSPGGGGGGGGGAPGGATTYIIGDDALASGYSAELKENDKLKFSLNNEDHTITIISASSASVKIRVESSPQEATLVIGEEKKFEVTGDSYYDVYTKLDSITNGSIVSLTVKKINEKVSSSSAGSGVSNESDSRNPTGAGSGEKIEKQFPYIWIIVGVLIVGIIIFFLFKAKEEKKS